MTLALLVQYYSAMKPFHIVSVFYLSIFALLASLHLKELKISTYFLFALAFFLTGLIISPDPPALALDPARVSESRSCFS